MKSPLVILHLEDDPADAALVKAKLEEEGIACFIKRVVNATDLALAFGGPGIDLVLSDMTVSGADGMTALELTRQHSPVAPFIIVARGIDEAVAIECRPLTLATPSGEFFNSPEPGVGSTP